MALISVTEFWPNPYLARDHTLIAEDAVTEFWGFHLFDEDGRAFYLYEPFRGAPCNRDYYLWTEDGLFGCLGNIFTCDGHEVVTWGIQPKPGAIPLVWDDSQPPPDRPTTSVILQVVDGVLKRTGSQPNTGGIIGWETVDGRPLVKVHTVGDQQWSDGPGDLVDERFWADPALPVLGTLGTGPGIRHYERYDRSGTRILDVHVRGWHRAGSPPDPEQPGPAGVTGHLYRAILGRNPDPGGAAYWTAFLAAGHPVETAYRAFFGSAEYQAMAPPDRTYLGDLYLAVLLRGADQGGAEYWRRQLTVVPRGSVLNALLSSAEFIEVVKPRLGLP